MADEDEETDVDGRTNNGQPFFSSWPSSSKTKDEKFYQKYQKYGEISGKYRAKKWNSKLPLLYCIHSYSLFSCMVTHSNKVRY
jgi:hypothetical protein